jgi:TIR domain
VGRGVFINYRCADSGGYAALLYLYLTMVLGDEHVFMDSVSIPAGHDYTVELLERARASAVIIVVIGPRWLSGPAGRRLIDDPRDWVRRELIAALAAGVRVIPVLVDGGRLPGEAELPVELAQLARCQYRLLRIRDVQADLARLRADLVGVAGRRRRRPELAWPPGRRTVA